MDGADSILAPMLFIGITLIVLMVLATQGKVVHV
jgi:hypothetical protein